MKYKVDWPCNIVLSSSAIEKYNKVSLSHCCRLLQEPCCGHTKRSTCLYIHLLIFIHTHTLSFQILQLLLQMKRASWALKNTFHQLKHCSSLSTMQTRQLQVYRHEYQHFVNVMHGYIANQLFQITWREFETDLQNEVCNYNVEVV